MFSVLVLVLIFRPSGLARRIAAGQGLMRQTAARTRCSRWRSCCRSIFSNGGFVNFLADAGAFVLLALGLNIVVGFAGLLDLGYAAFFAIGSYTFAMLASPQFGIHIPFWVMLFLASGDRGGCSASCSARRRCGLRGDYLAIVTLGFGEIVPQTFLNLCAVDRRPERHRLARPADDLRLPLRLCRRCRTTT